MAPKNTYHFNIPFSIQILISLFLIFSFQDKSAFAQTYINAVATEFSLIKPLTRCFPSIPTETTNFLIASDNSLNAYIYYQEGFLESIYLPNKSKTWRTELGGKVVSQLSLDPDNKTIYLVTKSKSIVISAIDAETGITKWQFPAWSDTFPDPSDEEVFLFFHQNLLISVCRNGKILSLDKNSGNPRWNKSISSKITSNPSIFQDRLILSGANKKITAINISDGLVVKQFNSSVAPKILLPLNKNEFLWTDQTGKLFFNGEQKFRAGAEITDLISTPRGILIVSKDNFLYLISRTNQKRLWKKKIAGRVFPKILNFNQWVIVPVLGEKDLSIIDLKNGKIINTLTIDEGNYFIGEFFIASELLFTPTAKGLYAFATTETKCPN